MSRADAGSPPPRWAPALVAAVACTGAFALWNPPLRDLAAHTFRAEFFEQHGFAIWNGTWYGGHYLPAYSVLFPPLAALLSPVWVGAAAAVASALPVRPPRARRAGESGRAGPACGSRRSARVALLANGWLVFALGVAFALGALRALQLGRDAARGSLLAVGSGAGEPGRRGVPGAGRARRRDRRARRRGAARSRPPRRCVPLALLGLLFPEGGEFPFWFSAWWPLALFCALALLATRGHRGASATCAR